MREKLINRPAIKKTALIKLKTIKGKGLNPGIDLDDIEWFFTNCYPPKNIQSTEWLKGCPDFFEQIRMQPNCVIVSTQQRHWEIFTGLCVEANAKGNLIPDAFFYALAIETGSEWITTDRDFSRFKGLRWSYPW